MCRLGEEGCVLRTEGTDVGVIKSGQDDGVRLEVSRKGHAILQTPAEELR